MAMNDGRFVKGEHRNPSGEFKKGEHWRPVKPYWNHDWLYNEYVVKQRSAAEIALDWDVTPKAILFWLNKHDIKTRNTKETRRIKKWGMLGSKNGMFGKNGSDNPHWLGGVTPERQAFYCSPEWAQVCLLVWKRDNATCQRCHAANTKMHIHHIVSFSVPELRAAESNLVLLCVKCHRFVHSRGNVNSEFIRKEE